MHLPDGRTLLTMSPHPFGGLIFVYDDVTDRLALECSYNTLIRCSARRSTICSRGSRSSAATAGSNCTTPLFARSGDCPRPISRASRISANRREDPDFFRRWRRLGRDPRADDRPHHGARRLRAGRSTGATIRCCSCDRAAARRRHAVDLSRCHRHRPGRAGAARAKRCAGDRRAAEERVHRQRFATSCARRSTPSSASPRSWRTSISGRCRRGSSTTAAALSTARTG